MSDTNLIPVLLIGYNRFDLIQRRLEELSQMDIKRIYISIDKDIDNPMKNLNKFIKKLDCQSKIIIKKRKKHLGLTKHVYTSIGEVLVDHDKVIIVEDDIKLSKNFYYNMVFGFKVLESNKLSGVVCGFSPITVNKYLSRLNKWRVSKYFSCWGWGCSRSIWKEYDYNLNYEEFDASLENSQSWKSLNNWQRKLWEYRFLKAKQNPEFTWDIQFQYLCFKKDLSNLFPVYRFVENEGFNDQRSVHTKEKRPKYLGRESLTDLKIKNNKITVFSRIISKFIDSNTIACDTKIFYLISKLRK